MDTPIGLDIKRILGNSVAIFVHALAFAILLLPGETPEARPLREESGPITIIPERKKPVAPTPRPITRDIITPRPDPAPSRPPVIAPSDHPMPTQETPGDVVADASTDTDEGGSDPGPALPPAPTGIQLLHGPTPPYPALAKRQGLTGTVVLRLLVGVDGQVISASVERSSGHRLLNNAALDYVKRHWRFAPAKQGGVPVIAEVLLPVEFDIDAD